MKILHTALFVIIFASLFPQGIILLLSGMVADAGTGLLTSFFILGTYSMPGLTVAGLVMSFGARKRGEMRKAFICLSLPLISLLLILVAIFGM